MIMQLQTNSTIAVNTAEEKLYDLCMIDQLCRGNQEKVNKMIQVFIKQIPQAVEEIKLAYNKRDYLVIKNVAHRIKPTLSYYAIVKIEKDIKVIEKLAKEEQNTIDLELSINKIDTVLNQVVEQMKKVILYYQ